MLNSDTLSDNLELSGTTPKIGLFASKLDKQLPWYVSLPAATDVNAFALSWACDLFLCNPQSTTKDQQGQGVGGGGIGGSRLA